VACFKLDMLFLAKRRWLTLKRDNVTFVTFVDYFLYKI